MTFATLAALAGALIAVGPTAPVSSPPAVRDAFERGSTAFVRGEYQRAIEILHPLLYPDVRLESEGDVVQAHRMLGVAYLFESKPDEARREFKKLLELRPEYRFDPLLDPQRVVDFFNGVLQEQQKEINDILSKKPPPPPPPRITLPPTVLRYEQHSFAVNFIPFGAGQFQNGQRRKGWFFFGTETALAAVSVGTFATNFILYGVAPHRRCTAQQAPGVECPPAAIDHSQEDTSRALLDVQLVSGGLFFAVAIWGVIDAIRNFQPDVLLPDDGGPGRLRAPAPPGRLLFSPGGVGAAWTF